MRHALVILSLLAAAAITAALPARASAEEAQELEERLLQAELAELGAGDLKQAMAAYAAIEGDEKAPAPLRARALLGLARSRRKLGELEAAKKALADLLQRYREEREVARQAESLLRELERGRAENPRFDWLEDLGKNPEVQARVFQLAMDAVSSDRKVLESTVRQLRALGTAALPVIDRVIAVSRDPSQRRVLALVSLSAGRADRLGLVLDPERVLEQEIYSIFNIFRDFFAAIPALGDDARRELAAAAEKVPEGSWSERYRQQVLILAGERKDLARRLAAAEGDLLEVTANQLAREGSETARVLAERLKDPGCKARRTYLNALRAHAPEALTMEHWVAFIERESTPDDFRQALDMAADAGQSEALLRAARGPRGQEVATWSEKKTATPLRAKLLRAAKASDLLLTLALNDDEAVPEYVDFLRHRADEDPEHAILAENIFPSPACIGGMTTLLGGEDAMTVAIALQWLRNAKGKLPAETFSVIERVALEAKDDNLRERALDALLSRFLGDPEKGPPALKAFESECARRLRLGTVPADYLSSPLQRAEIEVPRVSRSGPRPVRTPQLQPGPTGPDFIDTLTWVAERNQQGFAPRLAEVGGAAMRPVAAVFQGSGLGSQEDRKAFLARAAAAPELPLSLRLKAAAGAEDALFPAIDWSGLFASDDPFASELAQKVGSRLFTWARELPDEAQSALWTAGLASPQAAVRAVTIRNYPSDRPDFAPVIAKALKDPGQVVRATAAARLEHIQRSDAAPLLDEQLRHQDRWVRLLVIAALARFADRSSIPKLVELFDDPDLEVRDKALAAAQAIRNTLEEREKLRAAVLEGAKG